MLTNMLERWTPLVMVSLFLLELLVLPFAIIGGAAAAISGLVWEPLGVSVGWVA